MCTIITVSKDFYSQNKREVIQRIQDDSLFNRDGWSLLCLDDQQPINDLQLSSMNVRSIIRQLVVFFEQASDNSRIFLHARASTTEYTGIGFVHGFTDLQGRVIMHNGIIGNDELQCIDSYNLTALPFSTSQMVQFLQDRGDTYANVFVIDTVDRSYSVVRLRTGSLYTDGMGNYSTNQLANISHPVNHYSAEEFPVSDEPFFPDVKFPFTY